MLAGIAASTLSLSFSASQVDCFNSVKIKLRQRQDTMFNDETEHNNSILEMVI